MQNFYNTDDCPTPSGIRLTLSGKMQCAPDFTCGPQIRHMYILHYVIHGKGYYKANDTLYSVREGDVFVIFPDDLVFYYSEKEDPFEFCWIAFDGEKADEWMHCCDGKAQYVIHQNNMDFYAGVNELLAYTEHTKNISTLMLDSFLLKCLSGIQSSLEQQSPPSNAQKYVALGIAYMQNHYNEGITVSDVSDKLFINRSYFSKIFRQEKNTTPEAWLIRFRMEKAAELIQRNLRFSDVADAVGIRDQYYFSKLFKKYFGITCSQYRDKFVKIPT